MSQKWTGAEALRPMLVKVRSLEPYPGNPRRGQIQLIAESLERWGQVRPILVEGHRIVAGNHTFLAAKQLGWTHIAAVENKFADEAEAKAYLLADNRLPELGTYAQDELLGLLEEIEDRGGWAGTGYTPDDLDDLRALQDAIPTTAPEPFEGGYAVSPEEIQARQDALSGGVPMRELVLMLTADQAVEFEQHIKILRKETGNDAGITETVARAVAAQAALA